MKVEQLDSKELAEAGIRFENAKVTQAFSDFIREELELRIGKEISARVTQEQIKEFDLCVDEHESARWLQKNCPDYKEIILQKKEELEREIIQFKSHITGAIISEDNYKSDKLN